MACQKGSRLLKIASDMDLWWSALDESYAGYAHRSKHVLKSAWMRVRLAVGSSPLGTPMNSMEVAKPFDAHA